MSGYAPDPYDAMQDARSEARYADDPSAEPEQAPFDPRGGSPWPLTVFPTPQRSRAGSCATALGFDCTATGITLTPGGRHG